MGTEFFGKLKTHKYKLYPAVENIDHSKTKTKSLRTNGVCERFHKTKQDKFYPLISTRKYTAILRKYVKMQKGG